MKSKIALQRILATLKIITKSQMSRVDQTDCVHNLKWVSEWIAKEE